MTIRTPEWGRATEAIQTAQTALVVTHQNPDGDAIGSALGVANALRAMGKTVMVANDDAVPNTFHFLAGAETFVSKLTFGDWDVMISTDSSDQDRSGAVGAFGFSRSKVVINLDHHVTNTGFGDIHLVQPDASSAAEVAYHWLTKSGIPLTSAIATPLLTGIVTDTSGFRIPSVTPQTLQVAQALMEAGAPLAEITARTIDYMTAEEFALWQRVLPRVQRHGAVLDLAITREDVQAVGMSEIRDAGLVGFMRQVDGVDATVVWKVEGDSEIKVSMRAKPGINVAEVAFEMGGGGHAQAAGFTFEGTLDAARAAILPKIHAAIEKAHERA